MPKAKNIVENKFRLYHKLSHKTLNFVGHFGDPLALPNGNCEACTCYPPGTEQTDKGVSICEQLSGKNLYFFITNL